MIRRTDPPKGPRNNPYHNIRPSELTKQLNDILEKFQDEDEPHGIPSPSSVDDCTRRLAYAAAKTPKTNRTAVSSILAAEQGKATEPLVAKLLERAGYTIEAEQYHVSGEKINCPDGGTLDYILKQDDLYVGESKRLGLFRYLDVIRQGVKVAQPGYYTQAQLYMTATGLSRTILVAVSADHSAVRWYWTIRKYELSTMPPPIWTEEIIPNPIWLEGRVRRAGQIIEYTKLNKPSSVPRDFDPSDTVFPCNYCNWQDRCKEDGE